VSWHVEALGHGTPSRWIDDRLNSGIGHERRGGGGFYSHRSGIEFQKRIFWLNGPVKDGGGLYLYHCTEIVIANCIFIMNLSKWGGGVYLEKCRNAALRDNIFVANFAGRDGGAVSISYSENVLLERNSCILNLALRSSSSYDIHRSSKVTRK
jgi:Right handed beta helix region